MLENRFLRVYYGQIGRQVILLLIGGDKRTQNKDVKTSKELFASYKSGEK